MGALTVFTPVHPSKIATIPSFQEETSFCSFRRKPKKKNLAFGPVARLFGPAIFEASKLKVLILGVDEKKHPGQFRRTYTLTHSDISSKLTLAISHTINNSQLQGWYNWLQRDEVVAQWKKVKEIMSLHVHCHISGGHFLLDLCARLRYFIFCKELPVVLNAFVHGDVDLFRNYPELQEALVWVYFHSNIAEFNKVECWGPLKEAAAPSGGIGGSLPMANHEQATPISNLELLKPCQEGCDCCFPPMAFVPCSSEIQLEKEILCPWRSSLAHQKFDWRKKFNWWVPFQVSAKNSIDEIFVNKQIVNIVHIKSHFISLYYKEVG